VSDSRVRLALRTFVVTRIGSLAMSIASDIADQLMTPADLYHRARPVFMGIGLMWALAEFVALAGLMALPGVLVPAAAAIIVGLLTSSCTIGARAVYEFVTSTAEPHPGFWLWGSSVLLGHTYLLLLLATIAGTAKALDARVSGALTGIVLATVCARVLLFLARASTEFHYDSRIVSSFWLPALAWVLNYVADVAFLVAALWLLRRARK